MLRLNPHGSRCETSVCHIGGIGHSADTEDLPFPLWTFVFPNFATHSTIQRPAPGNRSFILFPCYFSS